MCAMRPENIKPGVRYVLHAGVFDPVMVVAEEVRADGKVRVRHTGGGWLWVQPQDLRTGTVAAPRHRVNDRSTAVAAAEAVAPRLSGHKWLVLCELVKAGQRGLTDFEYQARIGLKQTSAGKRRLELADAGLCERTGETRPSDTGSLSEVWRITEAGLRAWLTEREKKGAA